MPNTTPAAARGASIASLEGVGPARAREFESLGVRTLADLLQYFPRDYRREFSERRVSELLDDQIQTTRGIVVAVDYIAARPRARFEATLDDGAEKLALVWFNGAYLRQKIHPGMVLRVKGTVKTFRGMPQMTNPHWQEIEPEAQPIADDQFKPIYSATAKLSSDAIARVIDASLDGAVETLPEWFDDDLLRQRGLLGRRIAYRAIHRPANEAEAARARRRIVYDELMLMQLGLGLSKRMRDGRLTAPVMRIDRLLDQRIRRRFPFELTDAQQSALNQIVTDLQGARPMNRLLQGDVGSGKTVVALYAMLVAVANKLQAALLAPTEVLAEQHYLTLSNLLKDSAVKISLFTQRTKRESRGELARALANGEVHLAIGTQALIQEDMEFANLGLVVVDEQHKLGVKQRAVLKNKGLWPHYLVMTATPIPRTLALSYFADFDISEIDALPPGRQPIRTRLYRAQQAALAYDFVRQQVSEGRQAYVVVPRIEDDGTDQTRSVLTHFDRLSKGPLSGLRLAMLHGQMNTVQKQQVMSDFRDHRADVLVATTVIEVGIDVPNATVMVIDDAQSFGLSQLHQLRGRVGRGEHASFCLLISDLANEKAEARLRAMTNTANGFDIAQMDLQLRGPGEFFGTRQHGLPEFRMADVSRELEMLSQAREDALALLAADPALRHRTNAPLRAALAEQFGDSLALAQVG